MRHVAYSLALIAVLSTAPAVAESVVETNRIQVAPAPPMPAVPPPMNVPRVRGIFDPVRVDTVDVEVREGRTLVWQGKLTLTATGTASYQFSQIGAPEPACGDFSSRQNETRFSVRVQKDRYSGKPNALFVSLDWKRPTPGQKCETGSELTVVMRDVLSLASGQSQVVTGEAGVTARFSYRQGPEPSANQ